MFISSPGNSWLDSKAKPPTGLYSYLNFDFCHSLSLALSLFVVPSFATEKSQSIRESQASSPTLAAAARLSAMIHGKDRVYANAMLVDQVSGAEISASGSS